MIARGGCAEAYYALELCMGESGRVWAACQPQVRALRRCRDDVAAAATSLPPTSSPSPLLPTSAAADAAPHRAAAAKDAQARR